MILQENFQIPSEHNKMIKPIQLRSYLYVNMLKENFRKTCRGFN